MIGQLSVLLLKKKVSIGPISLVVVIELKSIIGFAIGAGYQLNPENMFQCTEPGCFNECKQWLGD